MAATLCSQAAEIPELLPGISNVAEKSGGNTEHLRLKFSSRPQGRRRKFDAVTNPLRDQLQSALGSSYDIERELGGGGMSRVFVATESSARAEGRDQGPPPELAAGVNVDRFKREILLAATAAASAHRAGAARPGRSTASRTSRCRSSKANRCATRLATRARSRSPRLSSILRDVAKALAYAHERGSRPSRHQARQRAADRRLRGRHRLRRREGHLARRRTLAARRRR